MLTLGACSIHLKEGFIKLHVSNCTAKDLLLTTIPLREPSTDMQNC